ncbi:MAG: arginine--tRNA ligase [Treponema sp.]|jgi:arginyl-tRNA synthetase|nr:arginine--tRNA ligase [Treponema sp.]
MYDYKKPWKKRIAASLSKLFKEAGLSETLSAASITAELPPRPELGDLGFPMFAYSKLLRKGPQQIAAMVSSDLCVAENTTGTCPSGSVRADGPYVNISLDRGAVAEGILSGILAATPEAGGSPGRPGTLTGKRIMVEYSSPNTNKPLHLGHLRNDVLGETVSRIFHACGAEVRRVCIINDRGIHICKSMLAYKKHGGGKTPESEGVKSDKFVGDWYVDFSRELKAQTENLMQSKGLSKEEAEADAPLMAEAREMLRLWEAGDAETVELWGKMNNWAVSGMKQTYERTGVAFDQYYYESQTYLLGKNEILKGLEEGVFFREEDGSVQVDLSAEKLDKKVLLRKDGTSIYVTQDIGTAIYRHKDWPFEQLIYVVGSEQQYHFKVLFSILEKLKFPWAKNLFHLSYGMVNLPDGKMKSREGTVVDADDLINSLRDLALEEIRGKNREEAVGDSLGAAEKIALGALHYFLLQVSPQKDMLFDPKESLSFTGNTGPYLQYMGARISSLNRKAKDELKNDCDYKLLTSDAEWELIKILGNYNEAVALAAANIDPSVITAYLYDVSKAFSSFYHDCPVLTAETPQLASSRLALSQAVLYILRDAMHLVCIPFLEIM